MTSSASLIWRSLTLEDAVAWADLMTAIEAADHFGERYTPDDLDDEIGSPTVEAEHDRFAVFDGDEMVAFGIVRTSTAPSGGAQKIDLWGGVRPSHRRLGIGRELLARMEARAAVHGERMPDVPAKVVVETLDSIEGRRRMLERAGYEIVRWLFDMERDLREAGPDPAIPADLDLVGFGPEHDEAVRRAHNEAFADHWGSSERSPQDWARWFTGSRHFRPDLSFVVLDGSEIAAYALCQRYPDEDELQGYSSAWLGQLGTRPAWRGRGLGTALVRRIVIAMREDGLDRAALDVDSANASGALALYEREGFRIRNRWAAYAREI